MKFAKCLVLSFLIVAGLSIQVLAQDDSQRIDELEKKVEKLTKALTLKSGSETKYSIGGYGEVHYNHQEKEGTTTKNEIDFHRFVLFFGYEFSDKLSFVSELEVEHAIAGDGQKGEVELEQAYLNYRLRPSTSLNIGMLLVPVGILNETHEPPTFYGVERNPVEKNIIPSTWWASGVSVKNQLQSGLVLEGFLHEGLYIDDSFSVRSGRQKSAKAKLDSPATTFRISTPTRSGLKAEASLQYQNDFSQGASYGGNSTLATFNLRYSRDKFSARALYAKWQLGGDAAEAAGKDEQKGFYLESSYRWNPQWGTFLRWNRWNTALDTDEDQFELGANYWLHKHAVLKVDFFVHDRLDIETKGINLGMGYQF